MALADDQSKGGVPEPRSGGIMIERKTVAFVCLHGSAKSLIAAEYLNGLAQARGLDLSATTSGPEPDDEVPSNVIEGLLGRGIDARHRVPERVSAQALARASHIVSFGCDLKDLIAASREIERWGDCPAVSDDFDIAWLFITGRVDRLFDRLTGEAFNLVNASPPPATAED
jgi:arsenate reductase (thioredoxin)